MTRTIQRRKIDVPTYAFIRPIGILFYAFALGLERGIKVRAFGCETRAEKSA